MKRTFRNSQRPSVWRHRDLRIAGPGRALSVLGDEIALVALLLRVHDSGGGARGITTLLVAAALPTFLLAPWAGRLADRVDSRLLVVSSAAAQVLVCLALAFAGPLWLMYVLVVGLQAAQAVANPAWQALVPRIVGEAEVGRAIGATQALSTLAAVAGAPLGGLLSGLGGVRLPLLADAASFGLLALAGLAVRTRRGGRHDPLSRSDDVPPRLLDGLRVLRADVLLWPAFIALMAYVVVGEATNVVEILLVRDTLGGTSVQYGLVGMAVTAGIVVGSVLAGRVDGTPTRTVVTVVAAAAQALTVLAAGLAPSVAVLVAVYALLGLTNGALNTATSALVFTRVPDAYRGRVGAVLQGVSRAFSIAALALGGVAGSLLGPPRTFVASGVACLVVAAALAVRVLPRRHLPAPVVPDDAPGPPPDVQIAAAPTLAP